MSSAANECRNGEASPTTRATSALKIDANLEVLPFADTREGLVHVGRRTQHHNGLVFTNRQSVTET